MASQPTGAEQQAPRAPPAQVDPLRAAGPNPPGDAPAGVDLDAERARLRDVEDQRSSADAERRRYEADLETIRTERLRLNAALIEATNRVRDTETDVARIEARLDTLTGSEEAIKHALDARRAVIGEVLAALQRMGRKPPPAILASPADMLSAIRTSMLLGAVVPELRAEAEALAGDLSELKRVRASILADRDTLSQETTRLIVEQTRLNALIEARQAAQARAEVSLDAAQRRAADLARQATGLGDLIGRMEGDAAAAHRAAQAEADRVRAEARAGGPGDPARLSPAVAFADAKGSLPLPAAGVIAKRFGASDGLGSTERGLSLATRPRAVVSTPADGWVSFSGPYRSYGQLLIINMGGGYYIVLAGLEKTDAVPGQFVLGGEPVGTMGDGTARTAATVALGATQPVLYVEFRKDGTAIDPSPWWAKSELEKVRG